MRSFAALIVLALMMLIAAIWVRCGLALAELGPPLDDAMLFGCSWGSFSIFVVVQLLPGVSSCVCEPDVCLHFCFPGSSGAFDTMKDLVGLFICSCVCGCLHAHDMQVPVSSGAFEFTYVLALFFSGSRVGQSSCALLGCGFCTWTAKVAFCEFVLLAACFAFVATVSGLEGPSGGNSFQPFDAMLAALLFSGMELVGHFTLFSGIELVGHFAQFSGICFEGRFKQFGWKRPAGQFRKGTLKDEESVALSVSLVSSKVSFQVSTSGTLAGNFVAPVLRLLCTERHKPFINFNDDRSVVVVETVLAAKAVAAFEGISSCVQSGTLEAQKFQPVPKVQFFVKGKVGRSTSVVRGGLDDILSHIIGTGGLDVYATVYGKIVDLSSTLSSAGIVGDCTVHIHHRLRGGSREDVPGQWTCSQCFAPRCWPVRKRCYRCGMVSSKERDLMLQLGHLVENRHLLQGMCRPQHVGLRLCLLEDRLVQGLEVLQLPRLLLRLPLKNWPRHSNSSRVSCHLKTSPSMRRNWCHQNSKNVSSSVNESFLRLLKGKPIMRNRNRSILK